MTNLQCLISQTFNRQYLGSTKSEENKKTHSNIVIIYRKFSFSVIKFSYFANYGHFSCFVNCDSSLKLATLNRKSMNLSLCRHPGFLNSKSMALSLCRHPEYSQHEDVARILATYLQAVYLPLSLGF